MRDLNVVVAGLLTETLAAVTAGVSVVTAGAACFVNAEVRSVPGSAIGWRRLVGRSGANWRRNGLLAACSSRSPGKLSPVISDLKKSASSSPWVHLQAAS